MRLFRLPLMNWKVLLVAFLFTETMEDFDKAFFGDPYFKFLTSYIEMVQILLDAILSFRDCKLYVNSFSRMMPYLNYLGLAAFTAPDVYHDFTKGNFVVKKVLMHRFYQVPVDQATEWQNHMCERWYHS